MSNEHPVASAIIRLMQGVVYRESDEDTWLTLERSGAGVKDHFATIGVDVVGTDHESVTGCTTDAPAAGESGLGTFAGVLELPDGEHGERVALVDVRPSLTVIVQVVDV